MSVVTFPESTTQSLLQPGVPVSNTVAMYDSELGSHTAPSHQPVAVHCYSSADFHSDGTGPQPQWCPYKSTLGDNVGIVLWTQGMSRHSRCENCM